MNKKSKNKHLMEVVFEFYWKLEQKDNKKIIPDPNYNIFLIKDFINKIEEYPEYEALPTSKIPAEAIPYIVQHRFRKDKNKWPVLQLGHGIITVNENEQYNDWKEFKTNIEYLLKNFLYVYDKNNKEKNELKIFKLGLRYLNAIPFDYKVNNTLKYLEDNLNTKIEFGKNILKDIKKESTSIDLQFTFPINKINSSLFLRFANGKKNNKDILNWNINIFSDENPSIKIDNDQKSILNWTEEVHEFIKDFYMNITQIKNKGKK